MLRNPIRYNDPTGHRSECSDGPRTWAACREQLHNFALGTLDELGGVDDLEAMVRIVERAEDLYGNYEDMIPALSGIFLGIEESNPMTINHARFANPCVAVGRDDQDLEDAGCPELVELGTFLDRGFHEDFQDRRSQPFHFWAFFATAANTWGMGRPGGYPAGQITGDVANILHEIIFPDDRGGASWQDYALSRAGMNLGGLVNLGVIPPNQLGNFMRYYLGTDGPGAFYVAPLVQIVPLDGNR